MSAPARACDRAPAASHSSVASLSTSPLTTLPQCPWLVYSQLQTSVMTSRSGKCALDGADRPLDDALVVVSARRLFVLRLGQAEEDDAADPQITNLAAFLDRDVDGHLAVRGHRRDRLFHAFARANKQGQNEIRGFEAGLPDDAANRFGGPQAAGPVYWKRHLKGFYRLVHCGKITIPEENARQTHPGGFIICRIDTFVDPRATLPAPNHP